jgi:lipoic acid synthetase
VVTSVNRDELEDGGASHFAQAIVELKRAAPRTLVEVLTPDFQGRAFALQMIVDAGPAVAAHNLETVERLTRRVRIQARYQRSLEVLRTAKEMGQPLTKTGVMLGLGETEPEVLTLLRDARAAACDIVTIGQYLQPTTQHLPVAEFVHPDRFKAFEEAAYGLGFTSVFAGPLVRSSYHAELVAGYPQTK